MEQTYINWKPKLTVLNYSLRAQHLKKKTHIENNYKCHIWQICFSQWKKKQTINCNNAV